MWQEKKKKKKTILRSLVGIGVAASLIFGIYYINPLMLPTNDGVVPEVPSFKGKNKSISIEPMPSPKKDNKDSLKDKQGKHCTYTAGCNCTGFKPKTSGKEWEKSYCRICGHHKKYHK